MIRYLSIKSIDTSFGADFLGEQLEKWSFLLGRQKHVGLLKKSKKVILRKNFSQL
jgi:hypothetical protein